PIAAAIAGTIIVIKRKQTRSSPVLQTGITAESKTDVNLLDTQTIFNLRPEMREDDKEIVKFIFTNGGQALESDLRKKFLQPRTTMWRAVKRLERQGVIEISKKDLQNLVTLKKELEEEY
ncbi:MAG: helix-turn-helix transcriptional regulator, partial [Nitrosopumilus sp.]